MRFLKFAALAASLLFGGAAFGSDFYAISSLYSQPTGSSSAFYITGGWGDGTYDLTASGGSCYSYSACTRVDGEEDADVQDEYFASCTNTRVNTTTQCAVGEDGAGKWRGIYNSVASAEQSNADRAHLNAPGLCNAGGMDAPKFCASPGSGWIPSHWNQTTTSHACYTLFVDVICAGDCGCRED